MIRVIATVLDVALLLIIVWFGAKVKDTPSKVGFGLMELAYVLSILGMWL